MHPCSRPEQASNFVKRGIKGGLDDLCTYIGRPSSSFMYEGTYSRYKYTHHIYPSGESCTLFRILRISPGLDCLPGRFSSQGRRPRLGRNGPVPRTRSRGAPQALSRGLALGIPDGFSVIYGTFLPSQRFDATPQRQELCLVVLPSGVCSPTSAPPPRGVDHPLPLATVVGACAGGRGREI